jgi:hypothetical protein
MRALRRRSSKREPPDWLLHLVQTETFVHHDRFDGGPEVSRGAHQISVDYGIVWQSERLGVANPPLLWRVRSDSVSKAI